MPSPPSPESVVALEPWGSFEDWPQGPLFVAPEELVSLVEWEGEDFEILALHTLASSAEVRRLAALVGACRLRGEFRAYITAAMLYKKVRLDADVRYLLGNPLRAVEEFAKMFGAGIADDAVDPRREENRAFALTSTRMLKRLVSVAINFIDLEL